MLATLLGGGAAMAARGGLAADKVPQTVMAAAQARHGQLGPEVFHSAEALPTTGRVVHKIKAIRAEDQQAVGFCTDESGTELADCGKALRRAERLAYYQDYGALSPELWQATQGAEPAQQFRVLVWLAVYEPAISRENALADPGYATAHRQDLKARRNSVRDVLQADLKGKAIGGLQFAADAPYALATLTHMEILALARMPGVAQIYLSETRKPSSEDYVFSINAYVEVSGFDGYGVPVCLVEPTLPQTPNTLGISSAKYCSTSTASPHARRVAGMVHSTEWPFGSAPRANVSVSGFDDCDGTDPASAIDWCATTKSANVFNVSFECSSADNRLMDYWVKTYPYPLITAAVANDDSASQQSCGTSCGTGSAAAAKCVGFNVLNVGGSNDCGDSYRDNDEIYCKGRFTNLTGTDREFPHVVAPAQDLEADAMGNVGSGTSYAAPLVAGLAAQLVEVNTAVKYYPELSRAIIMASATENVDGTTLSLTNAVDEKDGAGQVDALAAVQLAYNTNKVNGGNTPAQKGFDYGSMSNTDPPPSPPEVFYSEVYTARTTESGKRLRVVIAWDGTSTCTDPLDSTTCSGPGLDGDLDLLVYQGTTLVGVSSSYDNSFEFVEFAAAANTDYTIKIKSFSWTASSTYFGLAWAFDNYTTN